MDFKDIEELVKEFIEDSGEFFDEVENLLLALEQKEDTVFRIGIMTEILSLTHTFKGNAGMMGFGSIKTYAHHLEDLFRALQSETLSFDEMNIEYTMQRIQILRLAIGDLSPSKPQEPDLSKEIQLLQEFLAVQSEKPEIESERGPLRLHRVNSVYSMKSNVLRVDFERLDSLLDLMGELVIYRTRLGQIESHFLEELGEMSLTLELRDTYEQIEKISTALYEAIMKVRMLPLRHVFMRFPRLVRDISRALGKNVTITFDGEDTELDKKVIDEIAEPLMHLIQNAIDHGIETPQERIALGKDAQGTIVITASQESSHIIITIEDDGCGIDEKKLLRKAVKLGFTEPDSTLDLHTLVFLHGVTSMEEVTETSGRGLGMEVVKRSLEKINGSIDIETELGKRTRFTIKLPLTLAIISALMVEIADEQYAIPLASVIESIKIDREDIHEVNHREVVKIRERIIPLTRLSDVFGLSPDTEEEKLYIVIVQDRGAQVGFVVDRLIGRQDIVIKPLDDYFGSMEGIAGASILGDGRVVMIIDIHALTNSSRILENETAIY